MRFDPSEPYGQVFGIPGVAFSQNGRSFNTQGKEVIYHREAAPEDGEDADRVVVETVTSPDLPPASVPHDPQANNRGEMHWKHLKAKLDMFDEPYTTKEAALAFLAGKGMA